MIFLPLDKIEVQRLSRDLVTQNLRLLRKQLRPTWTRATIPSFMLRGFVTLTPYLQRVSCCLYIIFWEKGLLTLMYFVGTTMILFEPIWKKNVENRICYNFYTIYRIWRKQVVFNFSELSKKWLKYWFIFTFNEMKNDQIQSFHRKVCLWYKFKFWWNMCKFVKI